MKKKHGIILKVSLAAGQQCLRYLVVNQSAPSSQAPQSCGGLRALAHTPPHCHFEATFQAGWQVRNTCPSPEDLDLLELLLPGARTLFFSFTWQFIPKIKANRFQLLE